MIKAKYYELGGTVVEVRPGEPRVVVELDTGRRSVARVAGRLLKRHMPFSVGDRVVVGQLADDPEHGRIVGLN